MNYHIIDKELEEYKLKQNKKTKKEYEDLEKIRRKFVNDFPKEKILDLNMDEYVIGKGSKTSFCYVLEKKLIGLGNINGTPARKFGVYYNKALQQYKPTLKFGKTPEEAFLKMKSLIKDLLEAALSNDLNSIEKNEISELFKGKILATYYPEKFIPIFSEEHINFFLDKLDIKIATDSVEERKQALIKFKTNSAASTWSNHEFARFLYSWKNPKTIENALGEVELEAYLNAEDPNAGYIETIGLKKARKVNQRILNELKDLYKGQCQLCGEKIGSEFGDPIVHAHHIEYFSKTQNNSRQNIMILCPNHHAIIHRFNPKWNSDTLSFEFKNKAEMKLVINKHLEEK